MIDFAALTPPRDRPRRYDETMRRALPGGDLSLGFVWELAAHDEVFAAFLRRQGLEKP